MSGFIRKIWLCSLLSTLLLTVNNATIIKADHVPGVPVIALLPQPCEVCCSSEAYLPDEELRL